MLEVALATIHEVALIDEGKLHAPEQGWADPLTYSGIQPPDGWEVSISITDESGKFPLNSVPTQREVLIKILEEELEFDYGVTRELVSTLVDWIDEDDISQLNGAESEDYLQENPPYRAANAPLQSLRELQLLKIWEDEFFDEDKNPNEYYERLAQLVSLHNAGPINLNAAPGELLEVLALQDGWDPDFIFDGLDLPYLETTPPSVDTANSSAETGLLRVNVSLQRAEVPYTISAVVEPVFNSENNATDGRSLPGAAATPSTSADAPRTGTSDEQAAIQYPFRILRLNEYRQGQQPPEAARYSAVDIDD
jgi:general secretion pathway protein K